MGKENSTLPRCGLYLRYVLGAECVKMKKDQESVTVNTIPY